MSTVPVTRDPHDGGADLGRDGDRRRRLVDGHRLEGADVGAGRRAARAAGRSRAPAALSARTVPPEARTADRSAAATSDPAAAPAAARGRRRGPAAAASVRARTSVPGSGATPAVGPVRAQFGPRLRRRRCSARRRVVDAVRRAPARRRAAGVTGRWLRRSTGRSGRAADGSRWVSRTGRRIVAWSSCMCGRFLGGSAGERPVVRSDRLYGAGSGFTWERSDGEVSCMLPMSACGSAVAARLRRPASARRGGDGGLLGGRRARDEARVARAGGR